MFEVLEKSIKGWRALVNEVKGTYPYTVDDYSNDLSHRRLLALLVAKAPINLRQAIYESIRHLDVEFFENTVEADHVNLQGFRQPGMWWYDRIPKHRVEDEF